MKDYYINTKNVSEAFIREPYQAEKNVPWETGHTHGWQVVIIMVGLPNNVSPITVDVNSKEGAIELIEKLGLHKL